MPKNPPRKRTPKVDKTLLQKFIRTQHPVTGHHFIEQQEQLELAIRALGKVAEREKRLAVQTAEPFRPNQAKPHTKRLDAALALKEELTKISKLMLQVENNLGRRPLDTRQGLLWRKQRTLDLIREDRARARELTADAERKLRIATNQFPKLKTVLGIKK